MTINETVNETMRCMTPGRVVIITSRKTVSRENTTNSMPPTQHTSCHPTSYLRHRRNATTRTSAARFPPKGVPIASWAMQLPFKWVSTSPRKGERRANLVVTPMAKRSTISFREAVRIERRATLRAAKARFVPCLANRLHLLSRQPST
jgi:hypothetical protein